MTKSYYFLGAGGIGMSALERYFNQQGCFVAGYDKTPSHLTDAREAEETISELKARQEEIILAAKTEQDRLLKDAAKEREAIISRAREEAAEEAARILSDAKVKIEQEKQNAIRQIRSEVASLSLTIAEKIVRKDLSADASQQEYSQRLLEQIEKSDKR